MCVPSGVIHVAETPTPADPRHLTVERCDQLLKVYAPWLHATSDTTRAAAKRAVAGLVYERRQALQRERA